jgi:hypothetical protein
MFSIRSALLGRIMTVSWVFAATVEDHDTRELVEVR